MGSSGGNLIQIQSLVLATYLYKNLNFIIIWAERKICFRSKIIHTKDRISAWREPESSNFSFWSRKGQDLFGEIWAEIANLWSTG